MAETFELLMREDKGDLQVDIPIYDVDGNVYYKETTTVAVREAVPQKITIE